MLVEDFGSMESSVAQVSPRIRFQQLQDDVSSWNLHSPDCCSRQRGERRSPDSLCTGRLTLPKERSVLCPQLMAGDLLVPGNGLQQPCWSGLLPLRRPFASQGKEAWALDELYQHSEGCILPSLPLFSPLFYFPGISSKLLVILFQTKFFVIK